MVNSKMETLILELWQKNNYDDLSSLLLLRKIPRTIEVKIIKHAFVDYFSFKKVP